MLVDLPNSTLEAWCTLFTHMWLDFLGTLQNPWDCAGMLEKAQELWDKVYPCHPHVLAAKDKAVFNLVCQNWTSCIYTNSHCSHYDKLC